MTAGLGDPVTEKEEAEQQICDGGGKPLEVDRGGGEDRLDAHVLEAATDGTSETVVFASPWKPSERQRW